MPIRIDVTLYSRYEWVVDWNTAIRIDSENLSLVGGPIFLLNFFRVGYSLRFNRFALVSKLICAIFGLNLKFPYLEHIMLAGTEREPSKQSLWE